jgi:hypothetical protein
MVSTTSLEDVALAAPSGLRWFQVYIRKDRESMKDVIHRSEQAGYKALVVTVDMPVLGKRISCDKLGFDTLPGVTAVHFGTYVDYRLNVLYLFAFFYFCILFLRLCYTVQLSLQLSHSQQCCDTTSLNDVYMMHMIYDICYCKRYPDTGESIVDKNIGGFMMLIYQPKRTIDVAPCFVLRANRSQISILHN